MALDHLLQRWLAPLPLPTFIAEVLAERVLYRAPEPARLETLAALSSWNVEELLAIPGVQPLAWFHDTDGRHLTAEVSPEAAARLYRAGTTLYLKEVAPVVPIGDAIAHELGVPRDRIQCALFCNRPNARTQAHFDPVDTITMQLVWHKRWRLAPNRFAAHPTMGWAVGDGAARKAELWLYAHEQLPRSMPPGEEILLEPGALLSVPRGHWHATESGEDSVSLHVHHAPLPWIDAVLVSLRALLLRDPGWRRGADRLWDPSAREVNASTVQALLSWLTAAVSQLSPDDVIATPVSGCALERTRRWVPQARAGFVVEQEVGLEGTARVAFTVMDYGHERRTTVEMSRLHLVACRMLWSAALTIDELCARMPALDVDEARRLIALLLDAGALRAA